MSWFFGIFAGIGGLLGAILASRAADTGMLTFGLGLIVFAIIFTFWLVKDHYDEEERSHT